MVLKHFKILKNIVTKRIQDVHIASFSNLLNVLLMSLPICLINNKISKMISIFSKALTY